MEASDNAPPAASINYIDVTTKFKEMKTIYYTDRGCMVATLNNNFSKQFMEKHPNLQWKEKYNKHAEAIILTAKIHIIIFGQQFAVHLHRPIKQIHHWEYEYFFGFGGHNAGFSLDRIIMTFPETFDKNIDFEYLLMTGTLHDSDHEKGVCCAIDEKYIKNALKLLVIGGYVKQWNAFNHFKKWFKDHGFKVDFENANANANDKDDSNTTTSFLLEEYQVIEQSNS